MEFYTASRVLICDFVNDCFIFSIICFHISISNATGLTLFLFEFLLASKSSLLFNCASFSFKGFALVEGKPSVEVIYYIHDGQPQLKLGLQFNNKHLYKAINMFYREDKIKSTWIKFRRICM